MIKNIYYLFVISILVSACSKPKERILFSSSKNGNSDIFIMDFDGKNKAVLTKSKFEEWGPTWINENEISFLRQVKDSIFRIKLHLKTKEETNLAHPSTCILNDKNVLYSLKNKFKLYSCKQDIFIVNSKTKAIKNITKNIDGNARYPSWSNNGKSILYTSNHLGNNQIFKYTVSSEKLTQLTETNANNERGELSPNNKNLVYSSDYFEKGNQDILIKYLETGEIKNISNSPGMELIARFSNDGNMLFYGSNKDGNWEIYAYNIETQMHSRLTNNQVFDGDPRILKQ